MREIRARVIKHGQASGLLLRSLEPISFFGGVDAETGVVVEVGHPLEGRCLAGRVLAFPHGKGSTVGSYIMLRLARRGVGPAAILNQECETIVAVGAIIAGIPCLDQIDIGQLHDDTLCYIDGDLLRIDEVTA
jgi:hypothetical protein